MEFTIAFGDRRIVDAGDAQPHQPVSVELPILIAVGAEPVAAIVAPFIGEPHRDPIIVKRPEFLDQAIFKFPVPFAGQESLDRGTAAQEFGAVAPLAIRRIGKCNLGRVATVPAILGGADLQRSGFGGERRKGRSGHHLSPCISTASSGGAHGHDRRIDVGLGDHGKGHEQEVSPMRFSA